MASAAPPGFHKEESSGGVESGVVAASQAAGTDAQMVQRQTQGVSNATGLCAVAPHNETSRKVAMAERSCEKCGCHN